MELASVVPYRATRMLTGAFAVDRDAALGEARLEVVDRELSSAAHGAGQLIWRPPRRATESDRRDFARDGDQLERPEGAVALRHWRLARSERSGEAQGRARSTHRSQVGNHALR